VIVNNHFIANSLLSVWSRKNVEHRSAFDEFVTNISLLTTL